MVVVSSLGLHGCSSNGLESLPCPFRILFVFRMALLLRLGRVDFALWVCWFGSSVRVFLRSPQYTLRVSSGSFFVLLVVVVLAS